MNIETKYSKIIRADKNTVHSKESVKRIGRGRGLSFLFYSVCTLTVLLLALATYLSFTADSRVIDVINSFFEW